VIGRAMDVAAAVTLPPRCTRTTFRARDSAHRHTSRGEMSRIKPRRSLSLHHADQRLLGSSLGCDPGVRDARAGSPSANRDLALPIESDTNPPAYDLEGGCRFPPSTARRRSSVSRGVGAPRATERGEPRHGPAHALLERLDLRQSCAGAKSSRVTPCLPNRGKSTPPHPVGCAKSVSDG